MDYAWSSYLTCISDKSTKLKREEALNYFNDINNFKAVHKGGVDALDIERYLEI